MKRTSLITATLSLASATAMAADKPNVIFIITDQQSVNTIGALKDVTTGNYFDTPNMDRLVEQGYTFTNSYCANPVSMPSRFVLFTGLYGTPYEVRSNGANLADEDRIRPMLETNGMGNIFKAAGYDTYYSGKIHLPCSGEEGYSAYEPPVSYGFDEYLSESERGETAQKAAELIRGKKSSDKPFLLVTSFINPHDICMENRLKTSGYPKPSSQKLIDRIEMIKGLRAKLSEMDYDEFMAKYAPELPYNLETMDGSPLKYQKYTDEYWREYRWLYKELMLKVDAHVGVIMDALDANPKVKKNTIVVFTSDHGEMQGAHRQIAKQLPFDECQQVPLIIMGGDAKKKFIDTNTLTCGVDIIPTMCEMTGIKCNSEFEGISLANIVNGKDKEVEREKIVIEGASFLSVVEGDFKYTIYDLNEKKSEILVNLKNDPGEMKNLLVTDAKKYRAKGDKFKDFVYNWKEDHK